MLSYRKYNQSRNDKSCYNPCPYRYIFNIITTHINPHLIDTRIFLCVKITHDRTALYHFFGWILCG